MRGGQAQNLRLWLSRALEFGVQSIMRGDEDKRIEQEQSQRNVTPAPTVVM